MQASTTGEIGVAAFAAGHHSGDLLSARSGSLSSIDDMRSNRVLLYLALVVAFTLSGASTTYAHASLDHAFPAVGSTVHASPTEVRIWFSESIEPAFSSIVVADASGHRVDRGNADSKDASELRVGLAPLPPGTYTVTWRVTSVDAHSTEGNFTFSVAP